MPPIGRPRALDDTKRREVCALMAAGCSVAAAAQYVGCSTSTIRREALRNEDFHERLRNCELSAQLTPLRAMQKAAATHWRAAAWLLERTGPQRFVKLDPKRMDTESVQSLITQMFESMIEVIDDAETRKKVCLHVRGMTNEWSQDRWAAKAPRRDPKRVRRRMSPPGDFDSGFDRQPQNNLPAAGVHKMNPAAGLSSSAAEAAPTDSTSKMPESEFTNARPSN